MEIRGYLDKLPSLDTWTAREAGRALGFVAITSHARPAAEIVVMGVLPEPHRDGIGTQLLAAVEAACRARDVRFLQVKTLAPTCAHEPYARTRAFYEARGYTPLETFPTLWGRAHPCPQDVKHLG